jgi:RimJ/RimL family protein N-acetyltransferase
LNHLDFRFTTDRLLVTEWHSIQADEWAQSELTDVVMETLTPKVTLSLPPDWQGVYSHARASDWIAQRDAEGITLIIVERSSSIAIGFVILFGNVNEKDLRLGYLLSESSWGKGFGTELISGFINWCKTHGISRVTGGVEPNNLASIRVLEKNEFVQDLEASTLEQKVYVWRNI